MGKKNEPELLESLGIQVDIQLDDNKIDHLITRIL